MKIISSFSIEFSAFEWGIQRLENKNVRVSSIILFVERKSLYFRFGPYPISIECLQWIVKSCATEPLFFLCSLASFIWWQVKWKNAVPFFLLFLQKAIKKLDYIISSLSFSSIFLLNWTISMENSYYFEYFVVFSHYLQNSNFI